MDLPRPPDDVEIRNIIDKLASFVARNGPEFEAMTKKKQENNPKFQTDITFSRFSGQSTLFYFINWFFIQNFIIYTKKIEYETYL